MSPPDAAELSPGTAPAPSKRRGRPRGPTILLIVVVLLLGASLVLPWWSETELAPGPDGGQSTQNYAPFSGVTGSCSPACPAYESGPPVGPIQGTKSFASIGLNRTATLYYSGAGLVLAGLAGSALAAVTLPARAGLPSGRTRTHRVCLVLALLATAAASAILASLQPLAFRADVTAAFAPNASWTASPSPETSFWGSCAPGPTNGICASGWSVAWGPGLGWYMITLAAVVLMVVILLRMRRSLVPPGQPPAAA